MAVVLVIITVIITGGVVVWQVLIQHDSDESAWWNGVYTDRPVEKSVHKSVLGVVIGPFDAGLGEERPERPIGLPLFEAKRGRVAPLVTLHLNGAPFENLF